jgi:hypothetical protein
LILVLLDSMMARQTENASQLPPILSSKMSNHPKVKTREWIEKRSIASKGSIFSVEHHLRKCSQANKVIASIAIHHSLTPGSQVEHKSTNFFSETLGMESSSMRRRREPWFGCSEAL